MQIISIVLQVLGGLPLYVYHLVLRDNIMSAVATPDPKETRLRLAILRTFLVGMTTYPVAFLGCLLGARRALKRGKWQRGLALSSLPLVEMAALCGLLALWQRLEKNSK